MEVPGGKKKKCKTETFCTIQLVEFRASPKTDREVRLMYGNGTLAERTVTFFSFEALVRIQRMLRSGRPSKFHDDRLKAPLGKTE